jgi:hypothetical protein
MEDDMDQDKEIPFPIPKGFKLAQTTPDESVFEVGTEVTVPDSFLGSKILYKCERDTNIFK